MEGPIQVEENWLNDEYAAYYNANYVTCAEEFKADLELLQINSSDTLIDFGCGNGELLNLAAPLASEVYGLDISAYQIGLATKNLAHHNNVCLITSSFTDYHPGQSLFSKGFSRKSLHHLTDAEKLTFTLNVGPAFKSGALLYIEDGIFFEFERRDLEKNWDILLEQAAAYYGTTWEAKKHDIINSFTQEYPCGAGYWQECLERAGFEVIERRPKCSFYGGIMARKKY